MRNDYNQFRTKGVHVICIFGQKQSVVAKYVEEEKIPFPMLIDESRNVIKQFDVFHTIGIDAFRIAYPSLFLVNPKGKISFVYVGSNQYDRPSKEVIEVEIDKLRHEIG